ncbi:chorismate mutase [Apilactobacillus ozensis]|uniref:chorismate mutase n=1 Tax=Apilactobacillus ozensis TaxID=866801 RepID=UPI0006CF3DBF|nr:chorismate mutase [Apilactobacillus ozensis]
MVEDVYAAKKQQNIATKDQSRENVVLKRINEMTNKSEIKGFNQNIFQNIMDNSKKYQELLKTMNKE